MIPAYLLTKEPGQLVLDGNCLQYQREGSAPRLLPLRQISRLVLSGPMTIELHALLRCNETGIEVSFLDSTGVALARLDNLRRTRSTLDTLLARLSLEPDWRTRYQDWLSALERQAMLRGLKGLRISLDEFRDPGKLRATLDERLGNLFGVELVEDFTRRMVGLLKGVIVLEMDKRGFTTTSRSESENHPQLCRDFITVLRWHLEGTRRGFLLARYRWERKWRRTADPPRQRNVVDLFESERPRLESEVRLLLERFETWILEENRGEPR